MQTISTDGFIMVATERGRAQTAALARDKNEPWHDPAAGSGEEVFEAFTDRARRVVVLAQEEARIFNHSYIGTEHILLGLIREGKGVAAKALGSLEISLDAARQEVEEIIGQGQQRRRLRWPQRAQSGHIPFTPRARQVFELSQQEALQLGDNLVDTEHILLGLIGEGSGVAAQVLVRLWAHGRLNRSFVLGFRGQDV